MSTQAKPKPKAPQVTSPRLNVSKIDLSQLTLGELRELKGKVDEALSIDATNLRPTDILLEYAVRVRTTKGIISENTGSTRMNSILNTRMLPDAPSRFEHECMQQIFGPVNADVFDLFDSRNPTSNRLEPVRSTNDPYTVMPGLPTTIMSAGYGQTLPGE